MRYYKLENGDYLLSVGTGNGGEEITETEYDNIMDTIRSSPTATEGYGYHLKSDLTWELWDTEHNNPDNAPALWQEIEYRNGIRVIPAAIPATDPFKLGDYGWWGNDLYQSAYDGDNVWTPEGYPAAWTKINPPRTASTIGTTL